MGSCAAPSAKGDDKFITTDYLQQCHRLFATVPFWDITSVSALDRVVIKFRREGTEVEIKGMNDATRTLVDRFGVHDKPEEVEKLMGGH
ncbi:MAG: sodium-independent anion transporter [Enterobacter hormaechei]|nr:sodium-independent anion transporter [Enterobacter hormaechei]